MYPPITKTKKEKKETIPITTTSITYLVFSLFWNQYSDKFLLIAAKRAISATNYRDWTVIKMGADSFSPDNILLSFSWFIACTTYNCDQEIVSQANWHDWRGNYWLVWSSFLVIIIISALFMNVYLTSFLFLGYLMFCCLLLDIFTNNNRFLQAWQI